MAMGIWRKSCKKEKGMSQMKMQLVKPTNATRHGTSRDCGISKWQARKAVLLRAPLLC
jgi:hypothetical protein